MLFVTITGAACFSPQRPRGDGFKQGSEWRRGCAAQREGERRETAGEGGESAQGTYTRKGKRKKWVSGLDNYALALKCQWWLCWRETPEPCGEEGVTNEHSPSGTMCSSIGLPSQLFVLAPH